MRKDGCSLAIFQFSRRNRDSCSGSGGSVWQCSPTWDLPLEWCSLGSSLTLASCLTMQTLCLQKILSQFFVPGDLLRADLSQHHTLGLGPLSSLTKYLGTLKLHQQKNRPMQLLFSSLHLVILVRETKTKVQKLSRPKLQPREEASLV